MVAPILTEHLLPFLSTTGRPTQKRGLSPVSKVLTGSGKAYTLSEVVSDEPNSTYISRHLPGFVAGVEFRLFARGRLVFDGRILRPAGAFKDRGLVDL